MTKSSVSIVLLCTLLVLETSILGNAFVFYTGLPRYFSFFLLAATGFLISLPLRMKTFNKLDGLILFLLVIIALISELFFSLPNILFAFKMLILIAFVHFCIDDVTIMRKSIGLTFLHLSNAGFIIAFLVILLPESLVFETNYVNELRRQESGYGYSLYWSRSFSGLFLIGDIANPVPFLSAIPRYAGYFSEPAINGFYLCLSIALLYDSKYKFTKPVIILIIINFLITFSVTSFVTIIAIYFFRLLIKSEGVASMSISFSALVFLIIIIPTIVAIEYLQIKLGTSFDGSLAFWKGIITSTPLNTSSINGRIGEYNIDDINSISAFFWMSVLAFIQLIFIKNIFLYSNSELYNRKHLKTSSLSLWIIVLLIFSIKSISHYMFMPIIFVLYTQIIFANQKRHLKIYQ